ncbi:hypothetical protein CEUSTIGMA_g8821.t1 [Chlamydomonas eustigma]|uniref:Staygreen protein domain-containing protein n=1 Tax=Chlamydomonas eustigma TaxID=1157962 RepID=A0A250XF32_9CHLO|nr:hypothetical protein CEUSTIGMA_g8821.t1 [Chlamydomonas eustigma]|eukprot:GAX81390.1 hypothetical protein CEUSTIGMA_g8821.t1 [Chlamydomonas eustigma]
MNGLGFPRARVGDANQIVSGVPASACSCSGRPFTSAPYHVNRHKSLKGKIRGQVLVCALFDPPPFKPSKLDVKFTTTETLDSMSALVGRKYTLTHNDVSGELWLTVGTHYNHAQISGFYTRLLRDEVIAEWLPDREGSLVPELHLFCHVSGEERWLAPPQLRNYIFRREMPLVLDCVKYAEESSIQLLPEISKAKVYVHFQSTSKDLDRVECWGILGDRSTWKAVPVSILKRMLFMVLGRPLEDEQESSPTCNGHMEGQRQNEGIQQQPERLVVSEGASSTSVSSINMIPVVISILDGGPLPSGLGVDSACSSGSDEKCGSERTQLWERGPPVVTDEVASCQLNDYDRCYKLSKEWQGFDGVVPCASCLGLHKEEESKRSSPLDRQKQVVITSSLHRSCSSCSSQFVMVPIEVRTRRSRAPSR